ncbi:hypothetical protein HPP92_007566 [Vanilla planifolia]|uniref:Uncharacterized protein n=1 Tax=Vanilla planifolia TaxID=51239 RepID=A0A835VAS8_VANPL|nr:hypothetical protein HPP92_007566 [Vanilla planifolia]
MSISNEPEDDCRGGEERDVVGVTQERVAMKVEIRPVEAGGGDPGSRRGRGVMEQEASAQ